MDTFLANMATFIAPICVFIGFVWVVAIKKPHDTEEQHNREMLRQQLQSLIDSMNRLDKKAFEAIQKLEEAIKELTKKLADISESKANFDARLKNCEEDIKWLKENWK